MARPSVFFSECIEEYQQKGFWSDNLPVNFWERNDRAFHDKEAIVDSKVRLTCEHAKRQKDFIALGLIEMGNKRDEVTVAQLPNCVEFYLLHRAFK